MPAPRAIGLVARAAGDKPHGADALLGRQHATQSPVRIDGGEVGVVQGVRAGKEPMRQPVLQRDDDRARTDERRDGVEGALRLVRLGGDDDHVLYPEA